MGLFSKKKEAKEEDIPKLPELPELQESQSFPFLPKSEIPDTPPGLPKIETQTLPTLPNSETRKKFNQEAIKQVIKKPEEVQGLQKSRFEPIPIKKSEEKRAFGLPAPELKTPKLTKKIEPVFIRLDKFQTTLGTFEEIKSKVQEIEELLKRTREIKIKEEQELAEWEKEIQIIKSRIDLIDKNIFNKLD